jgi:hypothetical protein
LASERGFPETNDGEGKETGGEKLARGGVVENQGKGGEATGEEGKRKSQGTGQEEGECRPREREIGEGIKCLGERGQKRVWEWVRFLMKGERVREEMRDSG